MYRLSACSSFEAVTLTGSFRGHTKAQLRELCLCTSQLHLFFIFIFWGRSECPQEGIILFVELSYSIYGPWSGFGSFLVFHWHRQCFFRWPWFSVLGMWVQDPRFFRLVCCFTCWISRVISLEDSRGLSVNGGSFTCLEKPFLWRQVIKPYHDARFSLEFYGRVELRVEKSLFPGAGD